MTKTRASQHIFTLKENHLKLEQILTKKSKSQHTQPQALHSYVSNFILSVCSHRNKLFHCPAVSCHYMIQVRRREREKVRNPRLIRQHGGETAKSLDGRMDEGCRRHCRRTEPTLAFKYDKSSEMICVALFCYVLHRILHLLLIQEENQAAAGWMEDGWMDGRSRERERAGLTADLSWRTQQALQGSSEEQKLVWSLGISLILKGKSSHM